METEWACLKVKDVDELPTVVLRESLSLPGDKLWETKGRLQHAKSQLERCLFRLEDLVINYACVLAGMTGDGPGIDAFLDVPLNMDIKPQLPSAAKDLNEYHRLCKEFPNILRISIDCEFAHEVDEYQDGKDLQRDSLVLNGEFISGADYGYKKIVEEVTHWCSSEKTAKKILQALNRTFSGGTAFDHVLQTFGTDFVDITPASAEAKPLTVAVSPTAAIGSAHTRYLVFAENAGAQILEVNAFFTFRMVHGKMHSPFLFLDTGVKIE